MSTFAEPAVVALCLRRIGRLKPDAPAKWGRMNAHQMVCHLSDSFRVGLGERPAGSMANPVTRTLVKWVALNTSISWPHGAKTMPEVEQGRGGTPPAEWSHDVTELQTLIDRFAKSKTFGVHPFFGKMSERHWLIWGYRHTDHHLRQFGV